MRRFFSSFSLNERAVPAALLFVTAVSFGLLIPWLGFYWDDWPVIYLTHTQGTGGFWDFYQYDRPFSAWTYIVLAPLLGTSPIVWQIFTLLLRGLTAVFLWASLKLIWPGKPRQAFWVAVLFAVSPIFTQQFVAVAYSQHWICYLFYFCSIYFMLRAQRERQYSGVFTGLAAFFSLVQMLTMEYFLGLELLRPFILWLYYREREPGSDLRQIFKRVAGSVWVYAILLLGYVLWRVFFLRLAELDPNRPVFLETLFSAPIQALIDLAQKVVQDVIFLIVSWLAAVKPGEFDFQRPFSLAALVITIFLTVAFGLIASRYRFMESDTKEDGWHTYAMSFGLLAILVGTLPVWLIDRQVSVGPLGSRFSLAALFGISLVFVGFLEWLSPRNKAKLTVICLLVGMAIHANLHNAKAYQQSWEKQRTFYWQLFWRAPHLQPGTAFISNGEIFSYVGLYSTSMGISLLYPPVEDPKAVPYWFFSYWERLYRFPDEIVAGTTLEESLRNYSFRANSKDAILVDFSPENKRCLQILSLREQDDPDLPETMRRLLSVSNLSQVGREPLDNWSPPSSIFGSEPEHTWCYYYEKAELAYQYGDWVELIRSMKEAEAQGYAPADMAEYLPLLEAYLQTADVEPARDLSLRMVRLSKNIDDRVCTRWVDASEANPDPELNSALEQIRDKADCFD